MRYISITLLIMILGLMAYVITHEEEIMQRQEKRMKLQKLGELGDGSRYMGIIKLRSHDN